MYVILKDEKDRKWYVWSRVHGGLVPRNHKVSEGFKTKIEAESKKKEMEDAEGE